jgi:hypothetical protein
MKSAPLTLADCEVVEQPGRATLRLPGGAVLLLTTDDLERLAFLVRDDEPDPTPGAAAMDFELTVCECGDLMHEFDGEVYCPSCWRFAAA